MTDRYEEIRKLVRSDYDYPCLQELIAEIVIKTQRRGKPNEVNRYNRIIKLLLGTPKAKDKIDGYKDDIEGVSRVALLCKGRLFKDIGPMTVRDALIEVSREKVIPGYKIGAKNNPQVGKYSGQVERHRTRLQDKITEDNVDECIRKWDVEIEKGMKEVEGGIEDAKYTISLISEWLENYGRLLPRFEQK